MPSPHQLPKCDLLYTGATLVITPERIIGQWRSELAKHAPSLKVFELRNTNWRTKNSGSLYDDSEVVKKLEKEYDIVLVSYDTLGRELNYVEEPPQRNLRHPKKYARRTSCLVKLKWWRICLDEAQMVSSGVTSAARVARQLSRMHSWAVSGTPMYTGIQDLHGLLIFLDYKPFSQSVKLWNLLVTKHRHLCQRLFGTIAIRHNKALVGGELELPPQKRIVVTMPFSAVEQQAYTTMFEEMCIDVGVNLDGSPNNGYWDPNDPVTVQKMRSWLRRLRMACLHPLMNGHTGKLLGRSNTALLTVTDVLQMMMDENVKAIRNHERDVVQSLLMQGHVIGNNRQDELRAAHALQFYTNALKKSAVLLQDARDRMSAFSNKTNSAKKSTSEVSKVLTELTNNLRTALLDRHLAAFHAATATYQYKINNSVVKPGSDQFNRLEQSEAEAYDLARGLRAEILEDSRSRANRLMSQVTDLVSKNKQTSFPDIDELLGDDVQYVTQHDLGIFQGLAEYGALIQQWRSKLVSYIAKPLMDQNDDQVATGEEYDNSVLEQDALYAYFDALKALCADLNLLVTGSSAHLVENETRGDDASSVEYMRVSSLLRAEKRIIRPAGFRGSLQSSMNQARSSQDMEQFNTLRKIFSSYSKVLTGLQRELSLFRGAQNQRLEFYRQLQQISSGVSPWKDKLDDRFDVESFEQFHAAETKANGQVKQLKTKQRYFQNLMEKGEHRDEQSECPICKDNFDEGILTVCGHECCKTCIAKWWQERHTCPNCRVRLSRNDLHHFKRGARVLKANEEPHSSIHHPSLSTTQAIDSQMMQEINNITLPASFGTRIDTLCRHLKWLRQISPGTKSVIYSQFTPFLDILSKALQQCAIRFCRVGNLSNSIDSFKDFDVFDCLLLDARTSASGLTLTEATQVFICEPMLQTAVELQATARVHRIGQTQPTTVWIYLVQDSIEVPIYNLSLQRRLELEREGGGKAEDAVTAVKPAIDMTGDEFVEQGDLWRCLFGGG
ncbi:hypothetical protein K470DRAFT_268039 [Piedraia hortae CBS 480.64]|uniref:RING-type domain-containing protein n=1 Tax=Piedraia hortae CBS 480.64 TaxID=1314780 RepID=A0A6A7C968_9PEZI|nr:hypothetical protein K470DRAFT_268039 [Piedraia hortae CBS 480.64]